MGGRGRATGRTRQRQHWLPGLVEIGVSAMTLLRSLIVAGFAVVIARRLCAILADYRQPVRRIAWVLLLAPYFTPVLLIGYAYANFSPSLIHHSMANACFYVALLCWKLT